MIMSHPFLGLLSSKLTGKISLTIYVRLIITTKIIVSIMINYYPCRLDIFSQ